MNSYKSPFTPQITNPVNIDRPIQEIQNAVASVGWIEKSFGRAYDSVKKLTSGATAIYPQVWQGAGLDMLEVMPNDNLSAQSFIKVEDPIEVVDFKPSQHNLMRARISIIVWFNLLRVDPTYDYSYAEVLKGTIQRALTNIAFTTQADLSIIRTYEKASQVFSGYTLNEVRDQELIYPFGGFRFECSLTYLEDCPDVTL